MSACASERYEAADAKLNQAYQDLLSQLTSERQAKLKDAQQAWIRFCDASAVFVASSVEGGSMEQVLKLSELAEISKQRTQQLKSYQE